jgi:hypothetical protein
VFGGIGYDIFGSFGESAFLIQPKQRTKPMKGCLNDLWKYNISANVWTWISGENVFNAAGI